MPRGERYTPDFKGYLTYPTNSTIKGLLLREKADFKFKITIGKESVEEYRVSDELKKDIEQIGGLVERIDFVRSIGKNNLFKIPVEIRQKSNKGSLSEIRIRVTGKDLFELMDRIEIIKTGIANYSYGIQPTLCMWEKSGMITRT